MDAFQKKRRACFVSLWLAACGVAFASCGPDYIKRYDTALTLRQAIKEKNIDFPLPASAHNINYAMYADWQTYQRLVRFQAPVQDCIRHIDVVLAWDNRIYGLTWIRLPTEFTPARTAS